MNAIAKEWICGNFAFLSTILYTGNATLDRSTNVALPPAPVTESRSAVPVQTIATLQPTFAWSASKDSGVVYDLVVCEGLIESHGYWIPGKTVYHREGITNTSCTIEKPLSTNTIFVWSVRTRSGNRTSKWAEYMDRDWSHLEKGPHRNNILWPFKTPGN